MWRDLQRDILEDFSSFFQPILNASALPSDGWVSAGKYTKRPPTKTSGKFLPPLNCKPVEYRGTRYLSYREAAKALGVSEDKIYRMVKNGIAHKVLPNELSRPPETEAKSAA